MPMRFNKFRRWSIATLMAITLLAACVFAYVHATNPERIRERSLQASLTLHADFGVPMSDMYVTHFATELPIRDENGDITTGSCGPHFDLTQPRYDRTTLREMIPTIRKVVPRIACSHVAIYLNSGIYNDDRFVAELEASLPNVVVFHESRHFSRHSP
ncbi:secreted protein [Rhodopirellula europaea SH398]|uniref:Secreted protein n=2 Tax=Rhodopirellula TaxID=265488 RepID=M5S1K3_9BACT|nr:secreted protein [Rhodopirellula europaea SH398]